MSQNGTSPVENRPDASTMGYEQARDELVEIVGVLESGKAPLEATLQLWERGEALATRCRTILDQAQTRLEQAEGSGQPNDNASGSSEQADGTLS